VSLWLVLYALVRQPLTHLQFIGTISDGEKKYDSREIMRGYKVGICTPCFGCLAVSFLNNCGLAPVPLTHFLL
jgi:hypothetical protein